VRAVERLDPETQESLAKWLRTGALPSGPQARESTDARLVVTTRESLDGLVAGGRFRSDLAAALASVVVRVPPLRERPGDAVLLVAHFVQSAGQDPPALSERAGALLDGHPWPGNVAEAAALAVLIAARGPFASLHETELLPLLAFPNPAASGPSDLTDVQTLHEATLGHVVRVLALSGGVRSRAAKALGISPRTLYNHLRGRAETAQPRKR
jgi:DNA-binding NtrC family response regulator